MSDVRRIRLGNNTSKKDSGVVEDIPVKWRRSQDHHAAFSRLNEWELQDELEEVNERWKNWKRGRLVESGLALFDLVGKPRGHLFGDPIAVFTMRDGGGITMAQIYSR